MCLRNPQNNYTFELPPMCHPHPHGSYTWRDIGTFPQQPSRCPHKAPNWKRAASLRVSFCTRLINSGGPALAGKRRRGWGAVSISLSPDPSTRQPGRGCIGPRGEPTSLRPEITGGPTAGGPRRARARGFFPGRVAAQALGRAGRLKVPGGIPRTTLVRLVDLSERLTLSFYNVRNYGRGQAAWTFYLVPRDCHTR